MSTITPTTTRVLPLVTTEQVREIDSVLDDMLIAAVQSQKIAKVPAGSPNQARAWSAIGNVD